MKHRPITITLAVCAVAGLSGAARAQTAADDAALRAVAELAQVNGQALACQEVRAAQRAKALMLAHAPKTPRYADAFEQGTQRGFLAQTGARSACPEPAALAARLDAVAQALQSALAGSAHAPPRIDTADTDELPPHSMPRYLLQNPRGGAVTSEDFRGRFQLVTFGFTSCPDVCPTTLAELQQVLAALGQERAARLQPIFVTVDPQRDTPAVLEAYTRAFDARILALTGSDALVRRAADAFRVRVRKVQEPGARPDAYTIEHSAGLFLLGPDGQLLERIGYGTPAREIAARVEVWLAAAAAR